MPAELLGWPGVTLRPIMGCRAFFSRQADAGQLREPCASRRKPDWMNRAEEPALVWLRLGKVDFERALRRPGVAPSRLGLAGWIEIPLASRGHLEEAVRWLGRTYEHPPNRKEKREVREAEEAEEAGEAEGEGTAGASGVLQERAMHKNESTQCSGRFEEAFCYAAKAHAGQTRKGKPRPYIGHLMGVAALVLQYGGDEEQAIGALLHDTVEDAGGRPRLDDIRARFGARVARIVEGCSDSFAEDPAKKAPWIERKRKYVAEAPKKSADVKLVSAADKLYNVREILMDVRAEGPATLERFNGKRDGTLWYYRALAEAFRAGQPSPPLRALLEEYERAVAELERLAGSPS